MSHGLSIRQEANALTALAFRNGLLETLHSGERSALLEDPSLSRINDREMRQLMVQASATLADLLAMRERSPKDYSRRIRWAWENYAAGWEE